MRKTVLLAILGVSAVTVNAATITSGQYIGSLGAGTGQSLAGDRFRSFQPTGAEENYLGVPNVGTTANRVAQQLNWMTDANNPLTSFDFTFQYDKAKDSLASTILGNTIYWNNWSTSLASRGKTKGAADLNAFQITVKQGDIGSLVYLTDMVLDGSIALGSFYGVNGLNKDWLVTGSDMNLTDGFTLTGKLWLQGAFSASQENSAVNLSAGWDTRGLAPIVPGSGVPDAGTTLTLFGAALTGLAALRRKLSA